MCREKRREPGYSGIVRLVFVGSVTLPLLAHALEVKQVAVTARSMAYDLLRQRIWATSGENLLMLNPFTGVVEASIAIGGSPEKVVISDDGQYAHVVTNDRLVVKRLNIPQGVVDVQFAMTPDDYLTRKVMDVVAVPGWPTAVALSRFYTDLSPKAAGIVIYDKGIQLPQVSCPGAGMCEGGPLAFGDRADTLFAYEADISSHNLVVLTVDSAGCHGVRQVGGLFTQSNLSIAAGGGRIYATNGVVADAMTLTKIGNVAGGYPLPDPEAGRVFVLEDTGVIRSYNQQTLAQIQLLRITPQVQEATNLLRFGDRGLAFRTASSIHMIDETLVVPNEEPNLPPEITASGADPESPILVGAPVSVSLFCRASDPDEQPVPLTYTWFLRECPPGASVSFMPTPPKTADVAATLSAPGDYVFTCRVSDGVASSDAVVRVVATCGNKAPSISLELDSPVVVPGATIEADASRTVDPDSGPQDLRFHWEFLAGPDAPLSRIDLTNYFTVDTVREPGGANGSGGIDMTGYKYVVEGFDGTHVGVATAQGVPAGGMIGPFELGPYGGRNAVQLAQTSPDVAILVDPPVYADRVVYLVAGGNGDSDLAVRIVYADDTVQEAIMYCDDWFDDNPPQGQGGVLRSELLAPMIDGLDRTDPAGTFEDENDAAIFKGEITLQQTTVGIKEIRLLPRAARSRWTEVRTRFNLLGVWIAGSVVIASPDTVTTSITMGSTEGTYRFRLTVDDGDPCSGPQTKDFAIWVSSQENQRPVVVLATDPVDLHLHLFDGHATVRLDASGSYDPDHFPNAQLTCVWGLTQGPDQGYTEDLLSPFVIELTFATTGAWFFECAVGDGAATETVSIAIVVEAAKPAFRRGDANGDSMIDIADAIRIAHFLFARETVSCHSAADANDDGVIDISDAIKILYHLFKHTGPLPPPFGECGPDPTDDTLTCVEYAGLSPRRGSFRRP